MICGLRFISLYLVSQALELGEELERVQHGGVGADVQAGARWERHFVEQHAVLALAAQRADDQLERRRVGGTLLASPPEERERPLPVPRELQCLEQGRDVCAEELVAAGGQEGRECGERVRGDGKHQRLRGGGEEGVRRRQRLVRPPRHGGRRGKVERERVERERGGGRRRWHGREERAPFPRPRSLAMRRVCRKGSGPRRGAGAAAELRARDGLLGGAGVSSDTSRERRGGARGFSHGRLVRACTGSVQKWQSW
jgi:hypothetical protein